MSYTDIFGGNTIYPAEPAYLSLALSADTPLEWPLEQATTENVLAKIIDVTPTAPGLSIILPDARTGSTGYVATFYGAGANTFIVKDAAGNTLLTVTSGEAWNLYLRDNTTLAGAWRIFQMGAGTSSANASTLAGAGLVANGTTLDEEMEVVNQPLNYAVAAADRATVQTWTGGTGGFSLPTPVSVGSDWFVVAKNNGSGSLTITPGAGTIDGSATLILAIEESAFIVSDGTNYLTVGFGQAVNSAFDFVSINIAGTGTFTLTGAQLNRVAYEFTGLLTGNRTVIVPASVQQYWVSNKTTGAFTLTVKTALGTGVAVGQNVRAILYCDGTNVVNADDASSIAFPITTTQGGTGLASYVQGDMLYASAANVLSALPKSVLATRYLANTGASNGPAWDQVNLANGVTGILPQANLLVSGNFVSPFNGMVGAPNVTVQYYIQGNWCTLRVIGHFFGTSNSNTFSIANLPAIVRPASNISAVCANMEDNSLTNVMGIATILGGGTTLFFSTLAGGTPSTFNANGWTIGGTKGLGAGWMISYPLN